MANWSAFAKKNIKIQNGRKIQYGSFLHQNSGFFGSGTAE
jgi:hypothetical protein